MAVCLTAIFRFNGPSFLKPDVIHSKALGPVYMSLAGPVCRDEFQPGIT